MKCQFCGKSATVHLTKIIEQDKKVLHLCEACARQHDVLPGPQHELNLPALLHLLLGQGATPLSPDAARRSCPSCGVTYGEFRQSGRLGCPRDYHEFRAELTPLLERIHRSVRHAGKAPRRPPAPGRQAAVAALLRQLADAVAAERYEEAARLRDLIRDKESSRMNLDSLIPTVGEWLRGTGPESDVVVSTRIRLARNLAAFSFTNRASAHTKSEVEGLLRDRIARLDLPFPLQYIPVAGLSTLDRQFLVERQLVSRELANAEGPRGVAFDARESVSLMVNEEDHLRLQVMRSGLALTEAWQDIDRVDDALEARVTYAFNDQFGYLTACPTNVGTGMRASVMLHLPALGLTKQIEKVFRTLQKINLVVRGLYGEGSRASGDYFQISNQVTLGKSESAALHEISEVIRQIIVYERQARGTLVRENRQALHDRCSRALGTLKSASMMTSEETMELLSSVRLGINLGLIDDLTLATVNELFIHTQPAHLQKLKGAPLDGEERNAARASYLRHRLRELGPPTQ